MVGGWSIQVAVAVHWVGGGLANRGTGMYRVSPWVVLPRDVPFAESPVGLADAAVPASQPVAACEATDGSQ